MDVDSGNPVSALDVFHKDMQIRQNIPSDGYDITRMALTYNDTGLGRGTIRESVYDLPKSKNPSIPKPEPKTK